MLILPNYETNKLDHIQTTLEKNIKGLVHKYGQNSVESDLSESYANAENLRAQEIIYTKGCIQNIVRGLKSKMNLLKNKKIGEIEDFEKFKTELVGIQDNIMNMKITSKSELNKLKYLENDLNDDLNMYYNEKVGEWNKNLNISSFEFIPSKVKNKNAGQYKEVKQFLDFVHQSGGHENGWRKEDHLLFLKLRSKHKKIDDMAYQLHDILPDISIEEIKSHEEWYKKYLSLQSKKKEAIYKWKQTNNKIVVNANEREENNNIMIKKEQSSTSLLRERLMQWKIEKEEKLYVEKEMEKQKILDEIEKDRVKKQKQIETRKIVNEWRESKMMFEQSQREHHRLYQELEKRRRASNANKLIKQFQSMDELHVIKMRQVHKKIVEEPKKRVQSGPPVFRDPERLMRPTIQWAQRVRTIREPLQGPLPIFATPKLAIPEWRRNIV